MRCLYMAISIDIKHQPGTHTGEAYRGEQKIHFWGGYYNSTLIRGFKQLKDHKQSSIYKNTMQTMYDKSIKNNKIFLL